MPTTPIIYNFALKCALFFYSLSHPKIDSMGKDQTILFHSTIFGPIHSRRLGVSLGINLMPSDGKVCSFDCIYCEAGYNSQGSGKTGLPPREVVKQQLNDRLAQMSAAGDALDVITFSGNGEPTLHPDFPEIINDTIQLRNKFYPDAKVSVLTNSTRIMDNKVSDALKKVDNNILKLDSAVESTMQLIDNPASKDFTVKSLIDNLEKFKDTGVIQTMLLRGRHNNQIVDNTTPQEIDALISAYRRISPREIMIYSIDRSTPEENLQKVEKAELDAIAKTISDATGIKVATA